MVPIKHASHQHMEIDLSLSSIVGIVSAIGGAAVGAGVTLLRLGVRAGSLISSLDALSRSVNESTVQMASLRAEVNGLRSELAGDINRLRDALHDTDERLGKIEAVIELAPCIRERKVEIRQIPRT